MWAIASDRTVTFEQLDSYFYVQCKVFIWYNQKNLAGDPRLGFFTLEFTLGTSPRWARGKFYEKAIL